MPFDERNSHCHARYAGTASQKRMKFFAQLRSVLAAVVALSLTFFLTGCLQVEQIIKLKPDGTGTITMTIVMTKEALAMMKEFSKQGVGEAKSAIDEMVNEEKAKEQAAKLGEGVKFEKVEKIKNDIGEGAKMTFSFSDITKLKPSMDMQDMGGEGGEAKDAAMVFEFTKGSPAKLVVKTVHKKDDKANKPDNEPDGAELAQAAQMMKGMKLTMVLEVEGTIKQTDAAHRVGSRITFAEVPFDDILKDPAKFKAMNKAGAWADAVKVLKEMPGVKVEPKETVTIEFQ
jgi:hypothetical protein